MSLIKPKVIFSQETNVRILKEIANKHELDTEIVVFGKHSDTMSLDEILDQQNEEDMKKFRPINNIDMKSTAIILFSSGTTGTPKGTKIPYSSLHYFVAKCYSERKQHGKITSLGYMNPAWIGGTINLILSILYSDTSIIHDTFDPDETCKVLQKYEVSPYQSYEQFRFY